MKSLFFAVALLSLSAPSFAALNDTTLNQASNELSQSQDKVDCPRDILIASNDMMYTAISKMNSFNREWIRALEREAEIEALKEANKKK